MQPFTRDQFYRLLDFISTVIDFPGYHAIEVPEANKPLVEWFYNHPLFQRFYPKALDPGHLCWDSRTPCGWITDLHRDILLQILQDLRRPFPCMIFDGHRPHQDLPQLQDLKDRDAADFFPSTDYPLSSLDDRFVGISFTPGFGRSRVSIGFRWQESMLWIPELINVDQQHSSGIQCKVDYDYPDGQIDGIPVHHTFLNEDSWELWDAALCDLKRFHSYLGPNNPLHREDTLHPFWDPPRITVTRPGIFTPRPQDDEAFDKPFIPDVMAAAVQACSVRFAIGLCSDLSHLRFELRTLTLWSWVADHTSDNMRKPRVVASDQDTPVNIFSHSLRDPLPHVQRRA